MVKGQTQVIRPMQWSQIHVQKTCKWLFTLIRWLTCPSTESGSPRGFVLFFRIPRSRSSMLLTWVCAWKDNDVVRQFVPQTHECFVLHSARQAVVITKTEQHIRRIECNSWTHGCWRGLSGTARICTRLNYISLSARTSILNSLNSHSSHYRLTIRITTQKR
jgi:hypothetical protein